MGGQAMRRGKGGGLRGILKARGTAGKHQGTMKPAQKMEDNKWMKQEGGI